MNNDLGSWDVRRCNDEQDRGEMTDPAQRETERERGIQLSNVLCILVGKKQSDRLCLSLSLSVCLTLCLSVCLCLSLSVFLCFCLSRSLSPSLCCLSLALSISLSLPLARPIRCPGPPVCVIHLIVRPFTPAVGWRNGTYSGWLDPEPGNSPSTMPIRSPRATKDWPLVRGRAAPPSLPPRTGTGPACRGASVPR